MRFTWYGTASLSLEHAGTRILLDPFYRMNPELPAIPAETYRGADAILLTHGHVDHLFDIPKIMTDDPDVPVFCTRTPFRTLMRQGVQPDRMRLIWPEQRFNVGCFHITVKQGRHVKFDLPYIAASTPGCIRNPGKAAWLISTGVTLPENGEIVIYEIECEGKLVTVMGSFGMDRATDYRAEPDVLVLPYNGSTRIPALADRPLRELQPKMVIYDHFDNAFPPLTRRMDVEAYDDRLRSEFPAIHTLIPQEREVYTI